MNKKILINFKLQQNSIVLNLMIIKFKKLIIIDLFRQLIIEIFHLLIKDIIHLYNNKKF